MWFLFACVATPESSAPEAHPISGPGDTAAADESTDTGTVDTAVVDTAADTTETAERADTAAEEDSGFTVTCEVPDIRPGDDDPDPARVGDHWSLWLWCDGTLMLGVQRIQITPPEAGLLDENEVDWVQAGSVDIRMQAGSFQATETFVIGG